MLTGLFINNVVLIEKLQLDFSNGLTIFSGETGAGKSVLLDSLALISGARSDTSLIRPGHDSLCVSASFEIKNKKSPLFDVLKENGLTPSSEIIIRRILTADGKSKIFFNDEPVSLKLLKTLGSYLFEIHGQFDNQGLFNDKTHIDFLDSFGVYEKELEQTSQAHKKYKTLQKNLNDALAAAEKNAREEEILTHFAQELENMSIRVGEEKELTDKRTEMLNASKLLENLNTAYQALQGEGIASNIRHALSAIDKANRLTENKYQDILKILDSALVELDEAVGEIEAASENIRVNANDIGTVEERFLALKALARKHQCAIDDLPAVLENIKNKLASIQQTNNDIIYLKKELQTAKDTYYQNALRVHECRVQTAEALKNAVTAELSFLRMNKAEFRVQIEKLESENWHDKGIDNVYFEVKTNAGSPFGALSKIASGGELARFMLALKVNLASKTGIETLIFDEVDSGIGGGTAEAVGNRLYKLAQNVQVMAVTHSPQVASFGTTNFKVSKETIGNITTSKVQRLSETEKKEEIARMLSGEIISDEARAAADKLISKTA